MGSAASPAPTCCGYTRVVRQARVTSGPTPRSTGEGSLVRCPFCRHSDCRVIDSREVDDGQATRRRRSCAECGRRFTTVEEAVLAVRQAQRGHRAVQPRQGRPRGPAGLPGPPRRRGRAAAAGPPRRGGGPRRRHRRDPQPRGRAGHPRPAARARRGGLPALRERLPLVLLDRGLREGDRRPAPPTAAARGSDLTAPSAGTAPADRIRRSRRRRQHSIRPATDARPIAAPAGPSPPAPQERKSMTETVGHRSISDGTP